MQLPDQFGASRSIPGQSLLKASHKASLLSCFKSFCHPGPGHSQYPWYSKPPTLSPSSLPVHPNAAPLSPWRGGADRQRYLTLCLENPRSLGQGGAGWSRYSHGCLASVNLPCCGGRKARSGRHCPTRPLGSWASGSLSPTPISSPPLASIGKSIAPST